MKPPLSIREQKNQNAKALRGLMALAGKLIPSDDPLFQDQPAPVKRPRAAASAPTLPTEHQEQTAFVRWFRAQYPTVKIFAVPNAAVRDERLAAWMKAEGLSAGVPDLCVPAWNLWIEMKRQKGGVVSLDQAEWIAYLNTHGHRAIVCKGFDDAARQVSAHQSSKFMRLWLRFVAWIKRFNGAAPASAAAGSSRPLPAPPISSGDAGASCPIPRGP